ncbi:SRPBCC family protein [Trueperella pecoris]|uniref:SRPBCC family protein n=1 Tax=Trueperella pecoris TaxID=2733571 RepID=UPI00186B96A9|nr:SRPBCC family protein [Trueperella pecoris]QOQ38110.1 hypothetical protein HLG82_00710 [Trueperella pecoris]
MSIMDNLHAMTSLARTSVEEAARFGRLGTAVDHLLLALTLTDTPAGQLLRTQGAAYDATLAAMRDAEQDALESIGVTPPAELLPAEPTTTDGFTERAHRVFKKAKNVRPDYLAILESLLSEPSGTITTILSRLGTSAEELRTGIASVDVTQYQHKEGSADLTADSGLAAARATTSCPAAIAVVIDYLSDPKNTTMWEPSLQGRTLAADEGAEQWTAPPSGKGTQSRRDCAIRVIRETSSDESIRWRFEPIGVLRANIIHVTFTLIPDGETTTVQIVLRFTPMERPPVLLRLLRKTIGSPLARMHAESISGAVSRAFRP